MQRRSVSDARVIGRELRTEIDPFLEIRFSGRQLRSHREVSPPRASAPLHRDFHLACEVLIEELAAAFLEPALQSLIDTMADDVEEA